MSIRIYADGFCFYTPSGTFQKQYDDDNHTLQITRELEKFLAHQSGINKLITYWATERYALFPEKYVAAERDFRLMFSLKDEEPIISNLQNGVLTMFAIDEDAYATFVRHFPNVEFLHETATVDISSDERKLAVTVFDERMFVTATANGEILFSNSFAYADKETLLYHLANVFTQFSLSQTETPLVLTFVGVPSADIKKFLSTYFVNIQ